MNRKNGVNGERMIRIAAENGMDFIRFYFFPASFIDRPQVPGSETPPVLEEQISRWTEPSSSTSRQTQNEKKTIRNGA
ncbi:hypothetical protein [Methanosphaerula subterraneus]|uniref:hypothetical protein n=1 Tax=Methanosphaerula subterraneus TaxID=3350244 RepID=UPI003F8653F8